MKRSVFLFSLAIFFLSQMVAEEGFCQVSSSYTGKFTMSTPQVTLTLQLREGAGKSLTGTLSSMTGAVFQVKGTVEEGGVATGTVTQNGGGSYFEAYLDGDQMAFTLIQPDANGEPDYNKTQDLEFKRLKAGAAGGAVAAQGAGQPVNIYQQQNTQPQYQQQQQQYAQRPQQAYAAGEAGGSTGEVGDDMLGFKFVPPRGWVTQKTANGFIVGHNSVPGMIVVFPHTAASMQAMQGEMMQGIREEGTSLTASGNMRQVTNNVLEVDYSGIVNGQQVKGKGFGTLSPNSGGVYILALSTPDKLSKELTGAARQIATHIRFVQPSAGGSSDLMQFFADTWVTTTTHTSSYVTLYADGTWTDNSESSYSGNFADGGGNNTGSWGNAGQQQSRGHWTVTGTRDRGQLTTVSANGERNIYQYQVHIENGQKYYSEYFFNGTLFHRRNKYDN